MKLSEVVSQSNLDILVSALPSGHGLKVRRGQIWLYKGQRFVERWITPLSDKPKKITKRGRRRKS